MKGEHKALNITLVSPCAYTHSYNTAVQNITEAVMMQEYDVIVLGTGLKVRIHAINESL